MRKKLSAVRWRFPEATGGNDPVVVNAMYPYAPRSMDLADHEAALTVLERACRCTKRNSVRNTPPSAVARRPRPLLSRDAPLRRGASFVRARPRDPERALGPDHFTLMHPLTKLAILDRRTATSRPPDGDRTRIESRRTAWARIIPTSCGPLGLLLRVARSGRRTGRRSRPGATHRRGSRRPRSSGCRTIVETIRVSRTTKNREYDEACVVPAAHSTSGRDLRRREHCERLEPL